MRLVHCLLLLPLFTVTPALADQIACDGPFGADSSEERLISTFGAQNVVTGELDGPEGEGFLATRVFGDDEQKAMEFGWFDDENRAGVAYFTVPPASVAPGGVKIGMDVAEVEALNGEPFSMFGFGWDYGGSAGFQTGALAALEGGCYINVRFEPTVELPAGVDDGPISGDQEVSSDLPLLRRVVPRVVEINMGYPDLNAVED